MDIMPTLMTPSPRPVPGDNHHRPRPPNVDGHQRPTPHMALNGTQRPRAFSVLSYYDNGSYIYYGYVGPAITILVAAMNVLFIVTIIRGKFRTSTHAVLIAIAIADILTGIVPLPFNIRMFVMKSNKNYIPLMWCWVFHIVQIMSPIFFHLVSLGLTVGLSIERYFLVAFPMISKTILTMRNGIIFSVIVFIFSAVLQADTFLDASFEPVELESKDRTFKFLGCTKTDKNQTQIDILIRMTVLRLIPCVLLVIFTTLLLRKSSDIKNWRRLTSSNSEIISSLQRMDIAVSLIAIMVCVTELAVSCVLLAEYFMSDDVLMMDDSKLSGIMYVVYVTVSPINFTIMCLLSKLFRKTLKDVLFCCCCCISCRRKPKKFASKMARTSAVRHIS